VPAFIEGLLLLMMLGPAISEDLGSKIIANNADLVILVALKGLVRDWVDVHSRIDWLSSQFTELSVVNGSK
jgi:hypothetical protein